jgi:hypothetical protein
MAAMSRVAQVRRTVFSSVARKNTPASRIEAAWPSRFSIRNGGHSVSEVLDRPVRVRRTSSADHRATALRFGASDAWAQGLADMADALMGQGFYGATQPSTPRSAPTGFRRWCEEVLRPAVVDQAASPACE